MIYWETKADSPSVNNLGVTFDGIFNFKTTFYLPEQVLHTITFIPPPQKKTPQNPPGNPGAYISDLFTPMSKQIRLRFSTKIASNLIEVARTLVLDFFSVSAQS